MDLLAALRTNELERFKQTFTWRTKEGVTKRLPDMDTTHLFNTAKLLLNKFTEEQKANLYRRGPNSYACQTKNGQTIFFMVWEIEQRDNLDKRYRITYQQMLNSVFDHQFLFQELPQAIRPTQPPAEPAGLTPEQARNSLSEFGRAFYGIDYAAMEARVMGRFEPPQHVNSRSRVEPIESMERPSTAAREEELLGTRAFTPEQMFDLITRGSQGRHMDLTLWRLTIPDHFKEGVDWVIDERILRRLGNLSVSRNAIHQFVQNFQDFKQSALQAGDLTRTGWITPASYRTESERIARREMDERRGRGRTRALDYLRMMQQAMGPQFEAQLLPLLERNPGNRDLLEEFRYRFSRPESGIRGRNPLLMVMDDPAVRMGTDPVIAANDIKDKEPKKTPENQIEQLTQFGKRKIQLDDGDSNG